MRIHRRGFITLAAMTVAAPSLAFGTVPKGRIETLPTVGKRNEAEPRIRLWLPPGYDQSDFACQALYMLDGQYAFHGDSEGLNFSTDRRIARLIATGTIPPTLIVAIDNLDQHRFLQYMPQTIYDRADGDNALLSKEIYIVSGQNPWFRTHSSAFWRLS